MPLFACSMLLSIISKWMNWDSSAVLLQRVVLLDMILAISSNSIFMVTSIRYVPLANLHVSASLREVMWLLNKLTTEQMRAKALEGYFVRDAERNLIYCPQGEILRQKSIKRNGMIRYCNKLACKKCKCKSNRRSRTGWGGGL